MIYARYRYTYFFVVWLPNDLSYVKEQDSPQMSGNGSNVVFYNNTSYVQCMQKY